MHTVANTDDLSAVEPSVQDMDFGAQTITNAIEQMNRLRDLGRSVVPVRYFDKVAWLVVGYSAVEQAFMNEAEMPKAPFWIKDNEPYFGRVVSGMMGEEHRLNRALFGGPLMPMQIRTRVMQVLTPVANELIDEFGERREVDLVTSYTRLYPFRVISTLLGIPRRDQELVHGHVMRLFKFPWDPRAGREARDAMIDYLKPILEERREKPGSDLISMLASAVVNGKRMTDQELLDAVRFLYPAAGENTTNGLGMLMFRVLSDRSLYERLIDHPADQVGAVDEALRLEPPVPIIIRYLDRSVVIGGTRIPANHYVLLSISSANRDPRCFEEPDTFRLDRGTINHITFGRGPHFCLGTHLARAELRVTLNAVLSRLKGLRLVDPSKVRIQGALLRGPTALPVAYDAILRAA